MFYSIYYWNTYKVWHNITKLIVAAFLIFYKIFNWRCFLWC